MRNLSALRVFGAAFLLATVCGACTTSKTLGHRDGGADAGCGPIACYLPPGCHYESASCADGCTGLVCPGEDGGLPDAGPSDAGLDAGVCQVDCTVPPAGCHYENITCESCGALVCPPDGGSCDDPAPVRCEMDNCGRPCAWDEVCAPCGYCYECVNPATYEPWVTCTADDDCGPGQYCNDCARASCDMCLDCVAACEPTACTTEPEPTCDASRPSCGPNGVAVVRDGCWGCVGRTTCESLADVDCSAASDFVFPGFDKTCSANSDCTWQLHTINCCGTMLALGIVPEPAELTRFREAESLCGSQWPGCGCAQQATQLEDGNSTWETTEIGVHCVSGQCQTVSIN